VVQVVGARIRIAVVCGLWNVILLYYSGYLLWITLMIYLARYLPQLLYFDTWKHSHPSLRCNIPF
jgi:hypothetical protein